MSDITSSSHTKWECKYHIVFIPKYRKKVIYGQLRIDLGEVFHRLAKQKECKIEEGHLMRDHVHMLVSIPPKHSVAHIVGFLKGKSAIWIAHRFARKPGNATGQSFWARGYHVSTVGYNEEIIRQYIRDQEKSQRNAEQQSLFKR